MIKQIETKIESLIDSIGTMKEILADKKTELLKIERFITISETTIDLREGELRFLEELLEGDKEDDSDHILDTLQYVKVPPHQESELNENFKLKNVSKRFIDLKIHELFTWGYHTNIYRKMENCYNIYNAPEDRWESTLLNNARETVELVERSSIPKAPCVAADE